MPFKSRDQRKWMYANKPEMAKKWEAHTPKGKNLPKKVKKKKTTKESFEERLDAVLFEEVGPRTCDACEYFTGAINDRRVDRDCKEREEVIEDHGIDHLNDWLKCPDDLNQCNHFEHK